MSEELTTKEFISRLESIERELKDSRENRHQLNAHQNRVIEQIQVDVLSLDDCIKKITALLEGAFGQKGLVARIDRIEQQVIETKEQLIKYGAVITFLSFLGSGIGVFVLKNIV